MRKISLNKYDKHKVRKIIIINILLISLTLTLPRAIRIINNLNSDREEIINESYNIANINDKNDIIQQYYMMSMNYLELYEKIIREENLNNTTASNNNITSSDKIDISEIKEHLNEISKITESLEDDIDSLNKIIKHNNNENITETIITSISTLIVPIITLLYELLTYKKSTPPQNIIIESASDSVYMKLNKVSYCNNFIKDEAIVLVNGVRFEIVKMKKYR